MDSELDDEVAEMLEAIAGDQYSPEGAATILERTYGIDVSDMDSDDAVKMRESWEEGDVDGMVDVLEEYDVDDELIEQFETMARSQAPSPSDGDASPSPNGDSPSASAESDSPSREEVQQMIRQETPDAQEIVDMLKSEIQQPQQAQQGEGGGEGQMNPQQQMALKLLTEHLGGGGGGEMAKLGQQFQKAAMSQYLNKLQRPSLGDLIEKRIYEDVADEYAEEYKQEIFEGDPMEELESDEEGDGILDGLL
jgi:hypothetical protein